MLLLCGNIWITISRSIGLVQEVPSNGHGSIGSIYHLPFKILQLGLLGIRKTGISGWLECKKGSRQEQKSTGDLEIFFGFLMVRGVKFSLGCPVSSVDVRLGIFTGASGVSVKSIFRLYSILVKEYYYTTELVSVI